MIREFIGVKYSRTYIGDSIQEEAKTFKSLMRGKDDFSNFDWIEYRRVMTIYFDDILHVILSWKILLRKITIISLISSILFFKFPIIAFSIVGLSIIFILINSILSLKLKKEAIMYRDCLSITLNEIKKLTGLDLN